MRARAILFALVAAAACAADDEAAPAPPHPRAASADAWPIDGFLRFLPEHPLAVARLPGRTVLANEPDACAALARVLGFEETPPSAAFLGGAGAADALDPARPPGLAVHAGGWTRYLAAQDAAALNRSFAEHAARLALRQEGGWLIVGSGAAPDAGGGDAPLPPGDIAVRVHHHPLLQVVAGPGDVVEAGLTLGGAGFDLEGRVRAADGSAFAARARAAPAGRISLVDMLPSRLAVRIETSLAPADLAGFLARRLHAHCRASEDETLADVDAERVVLERFLREGLTALDPAAGIGIGLDFAGGAPTAVLVGRTTGAVPSPVLAKLRKSVRMMFGPLALDTRESAVKGAVGFYAWVPQAAPRLDGAPEAAWPLLAALCGGEDSGVPVCAVEHAGWAVVAAGPAADALAGRVRASLLGGARRNAGGRALQGLVGFGDGYLGGIVVQGDGLAALPAPDRAAMRAWFGAGPAAQTPEVIALALFRDGGTLRIAGRVLY